MALAPGTNDHWPACGSGRPDGHIRFAAVAGDDVTSLASRSNLSRQSRDQHRMRYSAGRGQLLALAVRVVERQGRHRCAADSGRKRNRQGAASFPIQEVPARVRDPFIAAQLDCSRQLYVPDALLKTRPPVPLRTSDHPGRRQRPKLRVRR